MGVQICIPVPVLAVGNMGEEVNLPGATQQICLKWVLGLTTPFTQLVFGPLDAMGFVLVNKNLKLLTVVYAHSYLQKAML